jgi:GH15 family glucan-1,4-alpha-glucosidase
MASLLEDYALIGDCETAGLVGRDGSLDWLCWPRFDSTACFAALIGSPDNGRWLLGALDAGARSSRRYRDRTLILETDIESADGAATVVDFMPPRGKTSEIVRLVYGRRGQLALQTELVLRFDYGSLGARCPVRIAPCCEPRSRCMATTARSRVNLRCQRDRSCRSS